MKKKMIQIEEDKLSEMMNDLTHKIICGIVPFLTDCINDLRAGNIDFTMDQLSQWRKKLTVENPKRLF